MSPPRETLFRWALAAIVVLGGAIRVFDLPAFPADRDEAFQVITARARAPRFWSSLRNDAVHPPLDYMVDRAVYSISPPLVRRRAPSLLWGALTVGVLGLLMRDRCGRVAGLLAATLLALAPYHVAETRRLRPYALAVFLICLSLYFLSRLIDRPTLARGACLFAAAAACFGSLYLAGMVLAIASAAMLVEGLRSREAGRRAQTRRAAALSAAAFALALAAVSPWLPVVLRAAHRVPIVPAPAEGFNRAGRILSYLAFSPNAGYGFPPRAVFIAGFVLAAALFAFGLTRAVLEQRSRFLIAWGPGALFAIEVLKRIRPHYDSFRYFLPAGIAITAMSGLAIARLLQKRRTRVLAAVLLAAMVAFDAVSLDRYYRFGVWDFSSGRTKTTSSGLTRPSFSRAFFSSS